MKKITVFIFCLTTLMLVGCNNHESSSGVNLPLKVPAPAAIKGKRSIAYISIGRYPKTLRVNLDKYVKIITDFNIAFSNPNDDLSGNLQPFNDDQIKDLHYVIDTVRKENKSARIYLAFGGWRGKSYDEVYEKTVQKSQSRQNFIRSILASVEKYKVDGVDLDWEYPRVKYAHEYALFVRELANALHKKGKYLSAAVIGVKDKATDDGDGAAYLDSVLEDFDNINLMAYDMRFAKDGNHSSYEDAAASINYWIHERHVPAQKALLGLPAYARPNWFDYRDVVMENNVQGFDFGQKKYACRDSFLYINPEDKTTVTNYYNGLPLIKAKTQLALNQGLAGVMMWELPLDSSVEELSIIKAMDTVLNGVQFVNYCDKNGLSY